MEIKQRERDEGAVMVTVVGRSGEEGFMAADEAENVFADLL